MIAHNITQAAPSRSWFAILGQLALGCGVVAFVGLAVLPLLWILSLAVSLPHGLEGVLGPVVGELFLVAIVALAAGWYFAVCGYVANGLAWPWRFGRQTLALLVLAMMSGCAMVLAPT